MKIVYSTVALLFEKFMLKKIYFVFIFRFVIRIKFMRFLHFKKIIN